MRRTALFVLAIALFAAQASAAPITVQALDPAATPAQNAAVIGNALFTGTAGITVTGVTYTGAARATGTFAGAGDVLGIEAGLLMTSGNVTNVVGPNNSTGRASVTAWPAMCSSTRWFRGSRRLTRPL